MIEALLAVFGSMLFGLAAIQNRRGLEKSNFISAILVVTIVGNIIFSSLVFLLVPLNSIDPMGTLFFVLAGLLTPGLARLTYFKGMERLGASLNASLNAIWPLFSSIVAVFVLDERLTVGIWIGMPCIVIGGILLERSMHSRDGGSLKGTRKDLIYPLLCAFLAGSATVVRKIALNVYDEPVMGVSLGYLTSLCVYVFLLTLSRDIRRSASLGKQSFRLFGKAALFMCGGWFCSLYALRYGKVIVVSSLRNTEPIFVLLFTHLFLRRLEKISLKLVVGTIVTLLGILCVTIL